MHISHLSRIGLTEGELKVYDALLTLGESTRQNIAKESGVSPSKIYDVASRLVKKGVISAVKKNGITHFRAADPSRLHAFLENKEREIQEEKQLVSSMLPELMQRYNHTKEDLDVEVFTGWNGLETVYDELISSLAPGEYDYVFGASQGHDSARADLFFSRYYAKREKRGFFTKIIFNEEVRKNAQRLKGMRASGDEVRFLHQDTFTEINLYKNTVLFIMLLKKPVVIRIRNKEAADSFRKFFNTMWAFAKV